MEGLKPECYPQELHSTSPSRLEWEIENSASLQETLAAKNCLANHLLLREIFEYLGWKKLTSPRLVCRQWNEMATWILKRRSDAILRLVQDETTGQFHLNPTPSRTLELLTGVMNTSENFPIVQFWFCSGNFENQDAQTFFRNHGKLIKTLHIYYSDDDYTDGQEEALEICAGFKTGPTALPIVGQILTNLTPNIETLYLTIPFFDHWPGYVSPFFPHFQDENVVKLVHLKTVHLLSCDWWPRPILTQLLKAAVNLISVNIRSDGSLLESLMECGMAHKITSLRMIELEDPTRVIEILEKFEKFKVALQKLKIYFPGLRDLPQLWPRMSILLSRLLHCSQTKLNSLQHVSELGFLPHIDFPVLPKIRDLDISRLRYDTEDPNIFPKLGYDSSIPRGLSLSRHLPNLNCLAFHCLLDDPLTLDRAASLWTKYFPPALKGAHTTNVETLILNSIHFPPSWFEPLSKLWINVRRLYFREEFVASARNIWTSFKKLRYLHITFDVEGPESCSIVDSCFTGFSREDCERLKNSEANDADLGKINALRTSSSILELKDLVYLSMNVCYNMDSLQKHSQKIFVFSEVTGLFAFGQLPQLQQVQVLLKTFWNMEKFKCDRITARPPFADFKVAIDQNRTATNYKVHSFFSSQ